MRKRILTMALACIFLIAGFLMTYLAFSQLSGNILPQYLQMLESIYPDATETIIRLLVGGFLSISLGLIFLLFHAATLYAENRKAAKELHQLNQRQQERSQSY